MPVDTDALRRFLDGHPPFDLLSPEGRTAALEALQPLSLSPDTVLVREGEPLPGLFAVADGMVALTLPDGTEIARVGPGASIGDRGLLRDGRATADAATVGFTRLYLLPLERFRALVEREPEFARFFRAEPEAEPEAPATEAAPRRPGDLSTLEIGALMTPDPLTIAPGASVADAARLMSERGVSCLLVADGGALVGLLTTSDLCGRVLAHGLPGETPVAQAMTPDPVALSRSSLGLDAATMMVERRIGHLPVVDGTRPVGIVTRTDLLLRQALSGPVLVSGIAQGDTVAQLAAVTARIPDYLAQLVGMGTPVAVVTRLITDITDALTRRLIALTEAEMGPPPVPYLWLVCGSQGRREQTGITDQDNCMILDDAATPEDDRWFAELARRVSDGLDACGFYYCPGDMMATNPRWRQRLRVWRGYFDGWIARPDTEAQMLASVMFDLRPVAGESALFEALHTGTLEAARSNSIFVAHMVRNALTHEPPLGLFRGFALIRSGEHRNRLDLKLSGVVPVVDLARVYALMGAIPAVGTRERLIAAREAGVISETGGRDLLDAWTLIAQTRLEHQAARVRAGARPDNFLSPAALSDLQRNHLRDAFIVVKTMQSALAQGRHTVI